MNIIDHGENDGLDFDLSGFDAVAHGIKTSLKEQGLMRPEGREGE
jgi:hypothetical protein